MQYAVGIEAREDIVPDDGKKDFVDHLRKEFSGVQVSLLATFWLGFLGKEN